MGLEKELRQQFLDYWKKHTSGDVLKELQESFDIALRTYIPELLAIGFPIEAIPLDYNRLGGYFNKKVPMKYVEVAIKWLPTLWVTGGFLNLEAFLRFSEKRFNGQVYIKLFELSDDFQRRWAICDRLEQNFPFGINDWVKETYLNPQYGDEVGLLALAVTKAFPKSEAVKILRIGFDLHPRMTCEAFRRVGTVDEVPFLKEKLNNKYENKYIYSDIEKTIKRLEKRKSTIKRTEN